MAKLNITQLKDLFQKMLDENPLITASGFGIPPAKQSQQQQALFDSERQDLKGMFTEFLLAYEWIEGLDLARRGNFAGWTTYALKRDAEKETGEYIPAGAFLLAALAHGCEMSTAQGGVSVYLTFP
jgi:hypothetical protein